MCIAGPKSVVALHSQQDVYADIVAILHALPTFPKTSYLKDPKAILAAVLILPSALCTCPMRNARALSTLIEPVRSDHFS